VSTVTSGPTDASPTVDKAERLDKKDRKGRGKQYYGRTAKRGALWSMMRQGGNELIGIPSSMIMARLLSPHDFGVAAAAMFFIQLAARLTQFGFTAALVRVKKLRPEHSSSVFMVNLTMGIISYLTLAGASPFIGRFFHSPEAGHLIPIAALTFIINPIGSISAAMLQRQMLFRYSAICDWTDSLVGSGSTILFAYLGFSYWSFVYGQILAVTIRVLLQMYLSQWRPSLRFSRDAMKELFSFGIGVQSKRLLEYAAANVDDLVVGRVLGVTALGLYDKAFTTMNRLVTRLTLGQAPFRIFSIIHEDGDRFRRAYSRLITSITLLGFPVLIGCIVVAQPLFAVFYGHKWQVAVLPFQYLCAGGVLKLLNAYASQANEASGNIWPQVRRQAVGAMLVGIGAAIGSKYGGVPGAAVGVLGAMVILTIAMQTLVKRATGLSWSGMIWPLVPSVTGSTILAFVLIGAKLLLLRVVAAPPALVLLGVQVAAGALFYIPFVLFSPFSAVREIVHETVEEMVPERAMPALAWLKRPVARV
jgi:O-antigen/teichoic acid export membrane protein